MKPLKQEAIEEARRSFQYFDRDSSGEIDVNEFEKLLRVLSPGATREQAEKGFRYIDDNDDGKIDFEEFLGWWQTCWWEF